MIDCVELSRRRLKAGAAFALLALVVELTGREITTRLDGALNVTPLATPTTRYYPFLLAGIRVLAALLVAGGVLGAGRAPAAGPARGRVAGRGRPPPRAPAGP